MLAMLLLAGCGSQAQRAPRIERAFDVAWRDHATSIDLALSTESITFHDGRWSARVSVHNGSDKPLYETVWRVGDSWLAWYGPALVYSGLDVLGGRRLIYVTADREDPELPFPLRPGGTWRGTISGRIPRDPRLPHGTDIWLRYPVFGIGAEWDYTNAALAVQVISERGVRL